MISIEFKDLYESDEICILNRSLYGFELCNCCGMCDDELYVDEFNENSLIY